MDLLVSGTSLSTLALITSWEGILSDGPTRGDIIEQDWLPGALWQPGPAGTYSFEVPVTMLSHTPDVAIGQLRTIQGWKGVQRTLTRQITVNGVAVSETCAAVMVNAVQVRWDLKLRSKIDAVLVFQNLSGGWS